MRQMYNLHYQWMIRNISTIHSWKSPIYNGSLPLGNQQHKSSARNMDDKLIMFVEFIGVNNGPGVFHCCLKIVLTWPFPLLDVPIQVFQECSNHYINPHLKEDGFRKQGVPCVNPAEIVQLFIYLETVFLWIRNSISLASQTEVNYRPTTSTDDSISHTLCKRNHCSFYTKK